MKRQFFDIHVHPGLKAYNNHGYPRGEGKTIWDYFELYCEPYQQLTGSIQKAIEETAMSSQVNLNACVEGNMPAMMVTMYPLERPFFDPTPQKPFQWLFKKILKKEEGHYEMLGAAVTGFPIEKVKKIFSRVDQNIGIDYFNGELLEEIDFYKAQEQIQSTEHPGYTFKIASNYEELQAYLSTGKTITGILTVEGAHALGHYQYHSTLNKCFKKLDDDEKQLLESSFEQNITTLKTRDDGRYTPFFITFCHHFNNLLAGHARSMSAKSNLLSPLPWPNAPGMRHLFVQEPEMEKGINALGKKVINLLLSRDNGRRILIDCKHMSIATRQYYHQLIRTLREQGDAIPIINSHAAINGWNSFAEADRYPEEEKLDKGAYFSRWKINLNNEEILDIYDSDGLVGVIMHDGRMPGEKVKRWTKKYRKWFNEYHYYPCVGSKKNEQTLKARHDAAIEHLRPIYAQLFLSNLFHIVKVIADKRKTEEGTPANGWKILGLGSDNDGLVDPFNAYFTVKEYHLFANDLVQYLNNFVEQGIGEIYYAEGGKHQPFTRTEVKKLLFDTSIETIIDGVMFNHVNTFLSKYFKQSYLTGEGQAIT